MRAFPIRPFRHASRFPIAFFLGLLALLATTGCAGTTRMPAADRSGDPVVLIHGLGLGATSMKKIHDALEEDGYRVCALDYPSRDYPIDTLVARFIAPDIHACFPDDADPIRFVTHSMGGILVRVLARTTDAPRIGTVVMIAPPNRGSEVVDTLTTTDSRLYRELFDAWGGPAGYELGTDSNSVPNRLARQGPPPFTFGVIAATRSLDPLFANWFTGRNDGKVAVERTKLEGMKDFIEVRASHTLVLWNDETVRQVRAFLRTERFEHEP